MPGRTGFETSRSRVESGTLGAPHPCYRREVRRHATALATAVLRQPCVRQRADTRSRLVLARSRVNSVRDVGTPLRARWRVIHRYPVHPRIRVFSLFHRPHRRQRGAMRLLLITLVLASVLTVHSGLTFHSALPSARALPTGIPKAPTEKPDVPDPAQFEWPLAGPRELGRPFEPPSQSYGPGHRGADLIGDVGQPVRAGGNGLVLYAGRMIGRNVVSIEHPGGLRTTYEPVGPTVKVGQQVLRGQPIGHLEAGHPGCTARPARTCLHWGARHRLHYLDPVRLVGTAHVRLLPWDIPPNT